MQACPSGAVAPRALGRRSSHFSLGSTARELKAALGALVGEGNKLSTSCFLLLGVAPAVNVTVGPAACWHVAWKYCFTESGGKLVTSWLPRAMNGYDADRLVARDEPH